MAWCDHQSDVVQRIVDVVLYDIMRTISVDSRNAQLEKGQQHCYLLR